MNKLITLLVFTCLPVLLSAQTDQWVEINSNASFKKLIQDCEGFWHLTYGHGFTYFEPETQTIIDYNKSNLDGLLSNQISDLEISSTGVRLLVNEGRLLKFDNGVISQVDIPFINDVKEIEKITLDDYDNIWFFSDEVYKFNYNTNQLSIMDIGDAYFIGFCKGGLGIIYFATISYDDTIVISKYENDLITIEDQFFTTLGSSSYSGIYLDESNNFWITQTTDSDIDDGGLIYRHNEITREYHSLEFYLYNYGFANFSIDSKGVAFMSAIKPGNFPRHIIKIEFDIENGDILSNTTVDSTSSWYYIDNDESFWYRKDELFYRKSVEGSEDYFDIRTNPTNSNYFTKQDLANDGSIWFDGLDLIYHFDGINWLSYSDEEIGITNSSISCIYNDSKNVTWIGTTDGLFYLKDGVWASIDPSNLAFDNSIQYLTEDQDSNLLILSSQHLFKFDGILYSEIDIPFVFEYSWDSYDKVVAFKNELVVLAEVQTLLVYKDLVWAVYTTDDPLFQESAIIHDFDIDSNGVVWLIADAIYSELFSIEDQILTKHIAFFASEVSSLSVNRNMNDVWMSRYKDGQDELIKYHIEDQTQTIYNILNSPIESVGDIIIDHHNNNMLVGQWSIMIFNPDGVEIFSDNPPRIPNNFPGFCSSPPSTEEPLAVFPNPASEMVDVWFAMVDYENVNINIFNISGQTVNNKVLFTQSGNISHWVLDVQHLNPGCYFIVANTNNKIFSSKLIIL